MVNRAKTRTLVRWSGKFESYLYDHDKELLLWLQYCCNESGIKIPYARVAQCMGPSFTEGAIIQHLAKIRTKMEDAGLHVPPAQKRGTVTRAASSIYKPKPKSTNAPVPRIRSETVASSSQQIICDEEEEEEVGQGSDLSAQPRPRRITKRQNATRKSATTVKEESDEDDPSAGLDEELYDSDNEYGAKKPRTRKKKLAQDSASSGNRGRIILSAKQPTLASYGYAATLTPDGLDGAPTFRGIRRKSATVSAQDNSSDLDNQSPIQNGSDGSQTNQSGQSVKRQKLNDDHNTHIGGSDFVAPAGESYQDVRAYGSDRSAMPPPALPRAPGDYGYTWDNEFMQGPFHNLSLGENHSGLMGGANAIAFPPRMPADMANFNMDFGSGVNNFRANGPQYPGPEYYHGFNGPVMSNASTRNNSFASASTNSTLESQPVSWQQPLRSPGFPNPHEATQVLHQAINTTGADESSFIDIFGPSDQNSREIGNTGESEFEQALGNANNTASSDLFVGLPEVDDDNADYSSLLNTEDLDV